MDRGAWRAPKTWTQLKLLSTHTCTGLCNKAESGISHWLFIFSSCQRHKGSFLIFTVEIWWSSWRYSLGTCGGPSKTVVSMSYSHARPHLCACVQSLQLCPTLCDLMDKSPPSSSVHGILQVRVQEFSSVQLLSCVWFFATPWTTAHQDSLSITNSHSSPKPMSMS